MKIYLTSFFLFLFSYGFAQNPSFHLSFQHLTPDEGLSQGTNAYIFKDTRGFVWISSLDGLNRFDGINVKTYKPIPEDSSSLFGRNITSQFFEDTDGNLWFTTNKAINCYQRATDSFQHFQLRDSTGQLITKDYYAFHLENNQQLYVRAGLGKAGRLQVFDITSETVDIRFPLDGHRCSVVLDEEKRVQKIISSMFFTRTGFELIDCLNDGKKTVFSLRELSEKIGYKVYTRNVFVENEKTLWIGSMAGLIEFDLEKEEIRNVTTFKPYDKFEGTHWSVIPFRENYLLVGTLDGGILLFDKTKQAFIQQFKKEEASKNSINSSRIRELYLDDDENLWVSRYEGGIAYANFNKVKFPIVAATKGQKIYSLFENEKDNTIWIGLKGELKIVDKVGEELQSIVTCQRFSPLENKMNTYPIIEPIRAIFKDKNETVYAVSGRRIFKFDETTKQLVLLEILEGKANAYPLKNGLILLIFNDEIHYFNPLEVFETAPFRVLNSVEKGYYTNVFEDNQERLYLAENATNLKMFDKKNETYSLVKEISNIGYCYHFFEQPSEQLLYIGTSSGLLKINTKTLEHTLFDELNHGIPNEVYYSVFDDGKGALWLSSNHGIIRYEPEKKRYHRFTVADGLQGNEFMPNAAIKTASGDIWLGGANGLNTFHPEQIKEATNLPEIQFTKLLINDELFTSTPQIGELSELKLPYTQNTISLDFAALEYSDAPNNQFKYQLVGSGYNRANEWIDNGNRGFARFANLHPGTYKFNVKGANSDGFWNEDYTSLSIVITPPFWMTWWFYILCILLISGIIYTIFQYRLEQALKVERMRVKISSDLHDDVGGLLSGLAMQSEILELTASETTKPKLRRIAEMSRSAMSRMRDTVWAIDARKDKMENLLDRMREHLEETIVPRDMTYDFVISKVNIKTHLVTDIRQNLYLIFKEAVTNIAKHSTGDKVLITLKNEGDYFEMSIYDNGTIEEKNYTTTGLGLSNMHMRASQIKATLVFEKLDGFKVIIRTKPIR